MRVISGKLNMDDLGLTVKELHSDMRSKGLETLNYDEHVLNSVTYGLVTVTGKDKDLDYIRELFEK